MILANTTRQKSAFTLLEMVVSLVVASILLGGLTSAMLLATQAIPDPQKGPQATLESSRITNQIAGELYYALSFPDRASHAVTFTVADRNGDTNPETIRYAWSGKAGDPLTRQYNDGATATVLENVLQFDLAYDYNEVVEQIPNAPIESAEQDLIKYESSDSLGEAHVHDNRWWAQYFKPSLPADAVSWKITSVIFMAKRESSDSATTTIQLVLPTSDNLPSNLVIDSIDMQQSALTDSYQTIQQSFTRASGLSPDLSLYLKFTTPDSKSARLVYQGTGVSFTDVGLIQGSPEWGSLSTSQSLLFTVRGTVMTSVPPTILTRSFLTAARITLRVGTDSASSVEASVQVLNAPEVTGP